MKKSLFILTVVSMALLASKHAMAYDHSEVAPSGQTLYYSITSSGAIVVYPGTNALNSWTGYVKPTGSLVIPDSVTYNGTKYPVVAIGQYAFSRCDSLLSVELPIGIKALKSGAFSRCVNLSTISLSDSLGSIGWSAFEYDSNLTQISLPDRLDSIEYGAFGHTGLTHIAIPARVSYIGRNIVPYCNSLGSISVDGGNTHFDSRNMCNAIIETSSNLLISGCKNSIIPNSIAKIGYAAFAGCTDLSSFIIPEGVQEIDRYAFSNCPNLSYVSLPSGLKKIENYTFAASGLTSIAIPDSVWYVGEYAFGECPQLGSINFGTGVTRIDKLAFYGCTSLQSVVIPNTVSVIMPAVFGGCDGMTSLSVGEGNGRYSSPNGCNAILDGNILWQACPTTVIPAGVNSIGWAAYLGFSSIDTVIIPEGVASIEREAFEDCSNLVYVQIPNSVTRIDDYVFYRSHSLEEVKIGSGIERIGKAIFDSTAIHTLHIGAFMPPTIDSTALRGLLSNVTIYVPCGTGVAYRNAPCWSEFAENIFEENCDGINDVETQTFQIKVIEGHIFVEGYTSEEVKVFDLTGREMRNVALATGIYLVRVCNYPTRKIVVIR